MEDAHICSEIELPDGKTGMVFGVFDGHGGPQVSNYLAKNFMKAFKLNASYRKKEYKAALEGTFLNLDRKIGRKSYGKETGSTCCVVLVTEEHYYCANAGDTRAILAKKSAKTDPIIFELSHDHKPSCYDEYLRITRAGHKVAEDRIDG